MSNETDNNEVKKTLVSVIDEAIAEIENLAKSSKFSASEIKIEGPGAGIGGQETNGKLDKDEDKDEDEEKDMDKGENEKADQDAGKFAQAPTVAKGDDEDKDDEDDMDKGENEKADQDAGKFAQSKTVTKGDEDMSKDEDKDEDDEDDKKEMKKSVEQSETLMKSYVDEKIGGLMSKIDSLTELVNNLADQPVAPKGVSSSDFAALKKNDDETPVVAPLSKSKVADQLFELKKSGTYVDTADIAKVECGSMTDVESIATKYKLNSNNEG